MSVYITHRHMQGGNGHEHIAKVRWQNTVNSADAGTATKEEMVAWLRNQANKAYVHANPRAVEVGVVTANPPYLRTHANGVWTDNLLALPTF